MTNPINIEQNSDIFETVTDSKSSETYSTLMQLTTQEGFTESVILIINTKVTFFNVPNVGRNLILNTFPGTYGQI
jgi:hypothetical protein